MTTKPYETTTKEVRLADMLVDTSAQRGLVRNHVDNIVNAFDPAKVGTLHVSHRGNGTHAIIDGQHRVAALIRLGYEEWRAEVYSGLTPSEEANLFIGLNNVRYVRPLDRFRARVTAGDPVALDIVDVARKAGWEIPLPKEAVAGNGKVTSVAALEAIYNAHAKADQEDIFAGRYGVENVLRLLAEAWGYREPSIVNPNVLRGVDLFLRRYKDQVDKKMLVKRLNAYPGGPNRFLANARGLASVSSDSRQSLNSAIAWQLTDVYNRKLSANRLDNWRG